MSGKLPLCRVRARIGQTPTGRNIRTRLATVFNAANLQLCYQVTHSPAPVKWVTLGTNILDTPSPVCYP